jgi:hypothetical protein
MVDKSKSVCCCRGKLLTGLPFVTDDRSSDGSHSGHIKTHDNSSLEINSNVS